MDKCRATRPTPALALALAGCIAAPLAAQDDGERWFEPTVSLGPSLMYWDLEDPVRNLGLNGRAGLRLSHGDVTLSVETWPNIRSFRVTTALIEASFYLGGPGIVRPLALLGFGHSWSTYEGPPNPRIDEGSGAAAAFGFGLHWSTQRALDFRTEAVMRTNDGGLGATFRTLVDWGRGSGQPGLRNTDGQADVIAMWMTPISGPWRFRTPAYGLRMTRLRDRMGGSLALAFGMWREQRLDGLSGGTDTDTFMVMPAFEWHPGPLADLALRVGPSITMMPEGPDDGASLGLHGDATYSPRWAAPLSVGAGLLWMRTAGENPPFSTADQVGITLFGAPLPLEALRIASLIPLAWYEENHCHGSLRARGDPQDGTGALRPLRGQPRARAHGDRGGDRAAALAEEIPVSSAPSAPRAPAGLRRLMDTGQA